MRKIASFLVVALLCASPAIAGMTLVAPPAGALTAGGGASCTTAQLGYTAASDGTLGLAAFTSTLWKASYFVADGTYTVCAMDFYLEAVGSPTQTLVACIYSHDGANNEPDTVVGSCSDGVDSTGLPGTETVVSFPNMSASITNAGSYWAVIYADAADASNNISVHRRSGATPRIAYDDDGLNTWSIESTGVVLKMQLYSE